MTQEQKDILLRDLCARLPYNVWVSYKTKYDDIERATILNGNYVRDIMEGTSSWVDFKPYLRPMSSMTEEEKRELQSFFPGSFGNQYLDLDKETIELYECNSTMEFDLYNSVQIVDFCKKNHLDCYGLIEKGLAIEVTDNNNPYKD